MQPARIVCEEISLSNASEVADCLALGVQRTRYGQKLQWLLRFSSLSKPLRSEKKGGLLRMQTSDVQRLNRSIAMQRSEVGIVWSMPTNEVLALVKPFAR